MERQTTAGEVLRRAREARRESLRQAAAQLEVAPSHLSRLERGEKSASKELLWRAARYYDLRPEDVGAQDVPEDIREILRAHPEIVWELRQRYGQ